MLSKAFALFPFLLDRQNNRQKVGTQTKKSRISEDPALIYVDK